MQARASRLSFNDIVKRLAATEESQPTFISKKVLPCPATCCNPLILSMSALRNRPGNIEGLLCMLMQSKQEAGCQCQQIFPSLVSPQRYVETDFTLTSLQAFPRMSMCGEILWLYGALLLQSIAGPACVICWLEATSFCALSGGNGGALCGGAWADHPEPVQELSQEERGQQRLCERPQGQDGAAPPLQALHCPKTQDALAGAYLALPSGSQQTWKWHQNHKDCDSLSVLITSAAC